MLKSRRKVCRLKVVVDGRGTTVHMGEALPVHRQ